MYNVSITRLRIRYIWFIPLFALHAIRSGMQAMMSKGIISFAIRIEGPLTFWTRTVWSDESSMKKYRNSGAHQLAMRILARVGCEASYVRWQQETANIPTWEEAHKALLEKGVLSKLKNPSSFHLAGHTAPPLGN